MAGRDYELTPYLEPIRDFREDLTVFSGLSHPEVDGGHPAELCYLTSAPHPRADNFKNTISLDQFAIEQLVPDTLALSPENIMETLGKPGIHPEGRFFPDTYTYAKGSSDLGVLKRAARAMDRRLDAAWSLRSPDTPLRTPEQALILASIVEKETGKPSDRAQIGGVFSNRLRIGMPLQTDPTVIYGLGAQFNGNLRRRDLQADTPYNTYTRGGLPPTPIAMPGRAALLAAVQPDPTKALYFVSRGDGSSEFSASLDEHNRAVNKYIKGRSAP